MAPCTMVVEGKETDLHIRSVFPSTADVSLWGNRGLNRHIEQTLAAAIVAGGRGCGGVTGMLQAV